MINILTLCAIDAVMFTFALGVASTPGTPIWERVLAGAIGIAALYHFAKTAPKE